MTFDMQCPKCESDVSDIEATVTEGRSREEFWGRPVSVDESECEIESVPPCPECGKVTISSDEAANYFWERVA